MKRLDVKATIVMDFIHVLEYLWKAAWCFFEKGDNKVEKWIEKRAIKILNGKCNQVAKGIKISATRLKLEKREGVDKCAPTNSVSERKENCSNVCCISTTSSAVMSR